MASKVLPITASLAVGYVLGRKFGGSAEGVNLRRHLHGNLTLLSRQERKLAAALIQAGHAHIFRSWPAPGIRDAEKRRLLVAAAAQLGSVAPGLEEERLAVLLPPSAPQQPKLVEAHGDARADKYYWLRDDDRKAPEVVRHLEAENAYTKAVMADTEALQEALYAEMRARIKEDDQQVPARSHGYYYYTRQATGQQYGIHCRRAVPPGAGPATETDGVDESVPEEVLLDENARKEALGVSYYSVGGAETSPDQKLYAWAEDTVGGEKYTLHVKDIAKGTELMKPIPGMSGNFEWAADNATLFYVVKDHLDRPYKVLRHKIGTPSEQDVVVYEEADEAFYVGVGKTRSEQLIIISSGSAVTSESRFIRADEPEAEFRVILPRVQDTEYSVTDRGSWLFLTLRDKARPNSELLVAPLGEPGKAEPLIPHSRDVKLEGVSLGRGWMVVSERSGGQQRARVYPLPLDPAKQGEAALLRPQAGALKGEEVVFDEPAYSLSAYLTGDFDANVLRMSYTSLTTPSTTIDQDLTTGKRAVKKVAPVLGGFDSSRYTTERLWATAADGVKVPISLVYRKDLAKLDGTDPVLLNGYGSYEISNDPYFSSSRLSLLDRGFVFVIAHVRGGGEMGRYWYEDGKMQKKANTFSDFIAVAEHLCGRGSGQGGRVLASPSKLCIEGRSAGGLLMGAVLNARPDLFHAAIIGVGFVDALTTMLDDTIPLTIIEREEWGDPAADPQVYAYMKSYSPVDNVKPQDYPHILALAGLHDPRVGYWEPAKLVAKLRELKTDARLLLLKTEMGAGHFSVTGRFERLKEIAFEYAFLLKTLGMTRVPLAGAGAGAQGAEQAGGAPAAASAPSGSKL
ncbi:hypothetical protein HYH03_017946 [Edaphochlamys debaryana]|uniref:Prolyl endopeptidase n=1 Tax=Edaphochlamys debaryana TaxID=47281 RepID=A0A835XN40_9CHLO|nr:hypothetical protein HYH03_017946 [Edaphochlamys debaryana]|eukprot:KAG2483154.1 hypothetical protein HYH03_017946 [Edaphochlamys debaryana]